MRHGPPGPGNGRTYTSITVPPPSFETYAIHRPSGENIGTTSCAGVLRKTVGVPGVQPRAASPSIGRIIRSLLVGRPIAMKARNLPLGCHDQGHLGVRAVGQPRDLAGAVGVHPVQIEGAGLGAIGREHDAPAVGRPDRASVLARSRRSIASACRAPTRRPRCRSACHRRCRAPASGRPARTADSPSRPSSRGAPTSCRRASSSRSESLSSRPRRARTRACRPTDKASCAPPVASDSRRRLRAPAPPGRSSRGDRDRSAPRRACPAAGRSDARSARTGRSEPPRTTIFGVPPDSGATTRLAASSSSPSTSARCRARPCRRGSACGHRCVIGACG